MAHPEFIKKINEENEGLKSAEDMNELLDKQDYIEILKAVWSEPDETKKLEFLKKASEEGHPILMLEYAVEYFKNTPTLEEYIAVSQPWMIAGFVRTQQDLACIEDPSAMAAV